MIEISRDLNYWTGSELFLLAFYTFLIGVCAGWLIAQI
jgi:hypothetical protein